MKLPVNNVFRLNDMLIFARIDTEESTSAAAVETEFRLCMKRRLYIRCMRTYAELFVGKREELTALAHLD